MKIKADAVFVAVALVSICLAIAFAVPAAIKKEKQWRVEKFQAWEKFTGNPKHLTIREWEMLGGQNQQIELYETK